jgi:cytochrome c6
VTKAARLLPFLTLLAPSGTYSQEELGRKVFIQLAQPPCALCHTLKAAGATSTVGPSLDELNLDKAKVLEAVRKGVGVMPPFADKLTPEQVEAVADYVARIAGK